MYVGMSVAKLFRNVSRTVRGIIVNDQDIEDNILSQDGVHE
jgi:hypothetical protein